MAYIRSTSNPENLYILRTMSEPEIVQISHGPPDERAQFRIPHNDLLGAIKEWEDNFGDEDVEHNGVIIKEAKIEEGTGKELPMKTGAKTPEEILKDFELDYNFKIRLQYKDDKVDMWMVTWWSVVDSFLERDIKKSYLSRAASKLSSFLPARKRIQTA